jgi:hypothetical protein
LGKEGDVKEVIGMTKNVNKLQLKIKNHAGRWYKDSLHVELKENIEKGVRDKR